MRMIDGDALMDEANSDGAYGYVDAKQISEAQTVDAVPVVRCRECKHKTEYFNSGKFVCKMKQCVVCGCVVGYIKDDDFCSYGERNDGDGNG